MKIQTINLAKKNKEKTERNKISFKLKLLQICKYK